MTNKVERLTVVTSFSQETLTEDVQWYWTCTPDPCFHRLTVKDGEIDN